MSKELQIRDGNLIASFDLENEDGDIDFCKLLKVSHGVAEEIGMFVDYIATNKIIGDQSKEIADLEAKLAESERKNFELLTKLNLKEYAPAFCTLADRDCEALGQIEELKNQLEEKEKEIEKLREWLSQYEANRKFEQEKKNLVFKKLTEMSEQLKSQPAEIVEKIKGRFLATCQIEQGNDEMIASFQTFNRCLDTILKEYQK